jgi:integrase
VRVVRHHPALDWRQAPTFMTQLAERQGIDARALAFTILTAARSGEVRGMKWGEVDLEDSVWTVPSDRIKAGKEHRVPLTQAARALLGNAGAPNDLVFPSPVREGKPLSDATLAAVLDRMAYGEITVHGFRSTFRDWGGETTAHPREVIEAALAHKLRDKAEAAYARGDLFQKRRKLMQDWADYLASPPAAVPVPTPGMI